MNRLTCAFVASLLIACGGFAAAPWRAMHSATDDGYSELAAVGRGDAPYASMQADDNWPDPTKPIKVARRVQPLDAR